METELTDFEDMKETKGVELFPVIDLLSFSIIDKEQIPDEGLLATIEKVMKVKTKYGDRYLLQTERGDVWLPYSEVKKLARMWGTQTVTWKGKRIIIKAVPVKVGGELKKTIIVEEA